MLNTLYVVICEYIQVIFNDLHPGYAPFNRDYLQQQ